LTYVFDNSPFSTLFRNFYPSRFPTLWQRFDELVKNGEITSTREVAREIEDSGLERLRDWAADNGGVFTTPNAAETSFVAKIFAVPHFQQNIELQKILKGGKNADAFVVAKASVLKATVVTVEKPKPKSAKIPNICEHFGIGCMDLEQFMESEGWQF
jgi:Domain of unknown function (DUF4411)